MSTQQIASKENNTSVKNAITYSLDKPEYYESMNEIAIHAKIPKDEKKKKQEDLERYLKNMHRYLHGNNKD
jgi:hypothetical protein